MNRFVNNIVLNYPEKEKNSQIFEKIREGEEEFCWLNSKQAAVYLSISENALRIMVHRRQVLFYKIRSRLRFKANDLDSIVKTRKEFK